MKCLKIIGLSIRDCFFKKEEKKVERPKTMADVPDSCPTEESDDENDTYKGLS